MIRVYEWIADCKKFIEHEPAVDADHVVRCKDCMHFEQGHCCIALGEAFVDSYEPEFTCGYADPRRMNGLKKAGANMMGGEQDGI